MSEPPAKRARREAVFSVAPPTDEEREADIARYLAERGLQLQRAGLTEIFWHPLGEILKRSTEEERVRFCRLDRSALNFCRSSQLYRELTERDYPEMYADWKKYSIVGGSDDAAADGSWALYYRLLQRNRQCRRAMTLYWTSEGREKAVSSMNGYETGGQALLPIEAHFMRLSIARAHELVSGVEDAEIDEVRFVLFGKTALPWSRFYVALQNDIFSREVVDRAFIMIPSRLWDEAHSASFNLVMYYVHKVRHFSTPEIGANANRPLNVEAAALLLQPDGPLRLACATYHDYTTRLAFAFYDVFEQYPWFITIQIIDGFGSYVEEPSNDWIFAVLKMPVNLPWQILAYFIFVDFSIALRTGDNRRLWQWFDTEHGLGRALVADAGPPLHRFIELLHIEDPKDEFFKTLAQIDYEDAARLADEAVGKLRVSVSAAANGLATLNRSQFLALVHDADRPLRRAFKASAVFRSLHLNAEHAASQAQLVVLRTQYQQSQQTGTIVAID